MATALNQQGPTIFRDTTVFRLLLFLFVITLPMTNAFVPHPWTPPPLMVVLASLPLLLINGLVRGRIHRVITHPFDRAALLFFLVLAASTALNPAALDTKSVAHLASYAAAIGIYYFGAKHLTIAARVDLDQMMKWVTISVLFAAIFGLVDFISKNFLNLDIDSMIPRPNTHTFNSTFALSIIRSRSFMSESANFASFLDTLAPLAVTHWWERGRKGIATTTALISLAALVSTFSTAGFVALIVGTTVATTLYTIQKMLDWRRTSHIGAAVVLVGMGVVAVGSLITHRGAAWADSIIYKLTFMDAASAGGRLERWSRALEMASEGPLIGHGAGNFLAPSSVGSGVVSWPIQILTEGGIIAVALGAMMFLSCVRSSFHIKGLRKYGFIMGLVALAVHYCIISDYWMPWIWFFVILIHLALPSTKRYTPSTIVQGSR